MSSPAPDTPAAAPESTPQHEVLTAVRNALQIGGSLLLTYTISLGVQRMLLPRYLGTEAFGRFSWADGCAAAFFILTTLGLETYIRKEVTLRPAHASDFFGGTLVLRVGLTALLMGALALFMGWTGQPADVRGLVYVFAGAQLLINVNTTLAAFLQARGTVGGQSIVNVVAKLVWGGGLAATLLLRASLPWLGVPLLVSEALKAVGLFWMARQHLGLVFRVDVARTRQVLWDSRAYFITGAALAAHGRTDVMLLGLLGSKEEVGFYGAAWGVAGLTMLLSPIFGWVLMPLMARAAARSEAELTALVRRSLEGCLVLTIPIMLGIGLGSGLWIHLLSGDKYLPGALALRILAPLFVLTYMAMVSSSWLTMANQAWTVTLTSVTGMFVNPLLNWLLIGPCMRLWGPSGGAAGSAIAMLATEVLVVCLMLQRMGRRSVDARTLVMLGKTLGVCACVIGVHFVLPPGMSPVSQLFVEAFVYVVLVLATGAVKLSEIVGVVRLARSRGRAPEALPT